MEIEPTGVWKPFEVFSDQLEGFGDFDDEYLTPRLSNERYAGRDPDLGLVESAKRKALMPRIDEITASFFHDILEDSPVLIPVGSTAVQMCTAESDLDLAIVVPAQHPLAVSEELFMRYSERLSEITDEFIISPRLLVLNIWEGEETWQELRAGADLREIRQRRLDSVVNEIMARIEEK